MIKKWIKDLRIFFVTAFANRCYNRAVKRADKHADKHHRIYYVSTSPIGGLYIIDRPRFRAIKREMNTVAIRKGLGVVNRDTMLDLKNGCFYRTNLRNKSFEEFSHEKELRRLAYINWAMLKAGVKN